ncbi:VOC family protein [Planosporangium thailandense]|uniref:VOC family protein n=1 Tax=Planosporangium thailandense TaxID=765197 RepID=A0ABX0XUE8_9ACTN|nr:VOC family protein [Planosporangium thailandense]NJC69646.1 VOC family protein [Planosporangium thailandense]
MATQVQVVIDCADPAKLAEFWALALGYEADEADEAPTQDDRVRTVLDPAGAGPPICLRQVPEPKAGKNRVHLDLHVGGGAGTPADTRRERIEEEAARLETFGAVARRAAADGDTHRMIMQDPEGNEFCLY